MHSDESPRLSVVVALLERIAVGSNFSRREWPAHVTLAPNFVVDAPGAVVVSVVRDLCAEEGPLPIRFVGEAHFGPNHSIPVQLVESDRVLSLHARLADLLEELPGFTADQPAFWRRGYRPHMTQVPGAPTAAGASRQLPYIAIAQMTASSATICAVIETAASSNTQVV